MTTATLATLARRPTPTETIADLKQKATELALRIMRAERMGDVARAETYRREHRTLRAQLARLMK